MKKESINIILLSTFLVVVSVILGLIIYYHSKPKKTDNNQINNDEILTIDRNDYLIKTFSLYGSCQSGMEFDLKDGIITELSQDVVNHITYNYLVINGLKTSKNEETHLQHTIIEPTSFISALKKLFGQNYDYNLPESITINNSVFAYNGQNFEGDIEFITCFNKIYPQFYNYKSFEGDGTYNVEYALYWQETTFSENPGVLKEMIYSSKDSREESYKKEDIENNLDKFVKYRFVFKNDGLNYIFDHIELANYY